MKRDSKEIPQILSELNSMEKPVPETPVSRRTKIKTELDLKTENPTMSSPTPDKQRGESSPVLLSMAGLLS